MSAKYWIGDPCYVLKEPNGFDWRLLLTFTGCFGLYDLTLPLEERAIKCRPKEEQNGLFEIKGRQVAVSSTAHGDGGYYDVAGNEYGVDAGLLGCVPLTLLGDDFSGKDLGHIFESDADNTVEYNDGKIAFLGGLVVIDTDPEWDDE